MAALLPFNWFQNGSRHIENHFVNFNSVCGTPSSTCVSNSVQMRGMMAELWRKMWFQYGGCRCLGFCCIRVLRVKIAHRPYSRCLCQIWRKSVHKWRSYGRLTNFKMAVAAILNCYLLTLDHPRSLLSMARTLFYNFISIALLLSGWYPFENFANLP